MSSAADGTDGTDSTRAIVRYGEVPHISVHAHVARAHLKPTPEDPTERKKKREQRSQLSIDIAEAVSEWHAEIRAKAEALSARFGKPTQYFLELLFNKPTQVKAKRETNLRNAFAWKKSQGRTTIGGGSHQLFDILDNYADEYAELLEPENEAAMTALKAEYEQWKESQTQSIRIGQRAKAQILLAGVKNLEAQFNQLCVQVGVDGFFCVFRNTVDFKTPPNWFFSRPEVEVYLPNAIGRNFDTYTVAAKLEAFVLAGCTMTGVNLSHKKRVEFLKAALREIISRKLIQTSGREGAVMNYTDTFNEVTMKYGVELVGWTHPVFANPSLLGTQIPPLTELLNAFETGACKFVRLAPEELAERVKAHQRAVDAGEIVPKERKKRSDAGKKRAASRAKAISPETIASDNEDSEEPPSPKRQKTSSTATSTVAPPSIPETSTSALASTHSSPTSILQLAPVTTPSGPPLGNGNPSITALPPPFTPLDNDFASSEFMFPPSFYDGLQGMSTTPPLPSVTGTSNSTFDLSNPGAAMLTAAMLPDLNHTFTQAANNGHAPPTVPVDNPTSLNAPSSASKQKQKGKKRKAREMENEPAPQEQGNGTQEPTAGVYITRGNRVIRPSAKVREAQQSGGGGTVFGGSRVGNGVSA